MQSAARVPILISFEVEDYPGPDHDPILSKKETLSYVLSNTLAQPGQIAGLCSTIGPDFKDFVGPSHSNGLLSALNQNSNNPNVTPSHTVTSVALEDVAHSPHDNHRSLNHQVSIETTQT